LPFDAIFVPDAMRDAVGDRAWLQAMLDAEAALARAQARAGVIPVAAAEAVVAVCRVERFDVEAIGREANVRAEALSPSEFPALAEALG
jgi:3-carboxy-cis,cis-muconate cycloisomerase